MQICDGWEAAYIIGRPVNDGGVARLFIRKSMEFQNAKKKFVHQQRAPKCLLALLKHVHW